MNPCTYRQLNLDKSVNNTYQRKDIQYIKKMSSDRMGKDACELLIWQRIKIQNRLGTQNIYTYQQ